MLVQIDREMPMFGCWLCDKKYPSIDGMPIHVRYGVGEGVLVRHLCGISRCINPMHLMRGSARQNTDDRITKDLVITEYLKDLMKGKLNTLSEPICDDIEYSYLNIFSEYWFYRWKIDKGITQSMIEEEVNSRWRLTFKKIMEDEEYIEDIGLEIYKDQMRMAMMLMRELRHRDNITILEV